MGITKILQEKFSTLQFSASLICATLFINILSLAFPIAVLQTYDRIIPNDAYTTLSILIIGVIVALILETVLRICRSIISAWADARSEYSTGCEVFSHLLKTSLANYKREGSGTHLERLNSLTSLKDFYVGEGLILLVELPFVIINLILIAYIGNYIVIVPIIMLIIFSVQGAIKGSQLRAKLEKRTTADDRRVNFVIEVLNGIHTIKSMAMEAPMLRRYERLQKK